MRKIGRDPAKEEVKVKERNIIIERRDSEEKKIKKKNINGDEKEIEEEVGRMNKEPIEKFLVLANKTLNQSNHKKNILVSCFFFLLLFFFYCSLLFFL